MVKRYQRKPDKIEALQYLREENIGKTQNFIPQNILGYNPLMNEYYLITVQGDVYLKKYDYIIKKMSGEFFVCKPDIFEKKFTEIK